MSLFLGRPVSGEPEKFYIEPFHTLITGQTNLSGKTTTAIALAGEAIRQGYTVLFFDTKPTTREFEGFRDIPICYQPTTDPLILLGLLEAVRRTKLGKLYATLARNTERARNLHDIINNLKEMEEKPRQSGFVKDACYELRDLLIRLDTELSGYRLSTSLELRDKAINVMPINQMSNEAQQLVVKTALEQVLRHHNQRMIVLVDEAFRFFPQDYGSACKRVGMDVITQGAKTKLFVWVSTQYVAVTEKDIMKPCANKILGRQDDPTEIEATMKRIPHVKDVVTQDELMTLKRGEFIFVPLEGKSVKIKVVPPWERPDLPKNIRDANRTISQLVEQGRKRQLDLAITQPSSPFGPLGPIPDPILDRKPPAQHSSIHEFSADLPAHVSNNDWPADTPNVLTVPKSKPIVETLKSVPSLALPPDTDHPQTARGKLAVILVEESKAARSVLNWTASRVKKKLGERLWDDSGIDEEFEQFIRWQILEPLTNKTYKFDSKRIQLVEKIVTVQAQ